VSAKTSIALTDPNLGDIAALGIAVPEYERTRLVSRILHIGVGGFHRAHMAVYTDDAAAAGGSWGIRGVGLLDADTRMAEILREQDCLYTVVERDSEASRARVVGSIVDYAFVAGDEAELSRLVSHPDLAVLSLTITEGGYSLSTPNATIETIVTALDARRRTGGFPLTVLSCDNLPGNGDVARGAIATVAAERSDQLAHYVETACTFPNSMVDRITPQTTEADRAWLREHAGIDDRWPVVCEPFRQWVVEDRFAAGRPAWDDVGVILSDRVNDWELYKLRMLNASHSCMAYLMALAGVVYVDEAMAIGLLREYLEQLLQAEAIPTLREIPGYPASEYAGVVLQRFGNTGVRDQIARLCIDGTAKFPSFLIPTVQAQLEQDGPVGCASLALAAWCRYLGVVPAADRALDSRGARAAELARVALRDPLAFLELDEVFTPPLRESSAFRGAFADAARDLAEVGALGAIERQMRRSSPRSTTSGTSRSR
jgi:mannitol 2-dehydrogenase